MSSRPVIIAFALAASWFSAAQAQNGVVVESRTVPRYATNVQLGIYVTNDATLGVISLPLELRAVTPGSYVASSLDLSVSGRVANSGLMDFAETRYYGIPDSMVSCSGPVSSTYSTPSPVDFVSPDAVYWVGLVTISGSCLPRGSDGSPGQGQPSFLLTFDVTGTPGTFVVDTCCVRQAAHFAFVGCSVPDVFPVFEKGTITISDTCSCPCGSDPICDSVTDVFDVVAAVNEAFKENNPTLDAGCPHMSRSDANCDCVVDVFDVVEIVNRAFRDDQTPFCDPCLTPCR